jgi:hypothetical protein
MKRSLLFSLLLTASFLAQAQFNYFKGILTGANESTPNSSTAIGLVIVKYNNVTNQLELFGHYRGLSATISGSSIYEAPANSDGPVVLPLTNSGGTAGSLSALATLTEAQEATLQAEGMYVNVLSEGAFATGEIRAQLTFTTGQTDFITARLQSSSEVPPKPSTANGRTTALVDRAANMLYLTGTYNNLTGTITGSHIHNGGFGVNGPVVFPLINTGGSTGVLESVTGIDDAQETLIVTGGAYVNVHSNGTYPGGNYLDGEIRGQLTNSAQQTFFAGTLSGSNESTPNSSTATGTVIVRYDPNTNLFELTGDYQNLSAAISASNIHGPAAYGVDASPIYAITNTGGTTGTLSLTTTLTDAQEGDLYSGLLYVNVNSTGAYAAGEIRVQLYYTAIGRSHYFQGVLEGSQEVPPSGSAGTGTVTSLLDAVTGMVYVTGSFANLGSNATMAHIHQGRPGQVGPVILPLSVTLATSGTVTGSGMLTNDQIVEMINGGMYVNIHSANIPTGELRAQLGNLVLPLKLLTFNAARERDKVSLTWTTAQETDLLSYEVEQQHPSTGNWTKKGVVAATGASGNYRFSDVPLTGNSPVLLYRLRVNETTGAVRYSNVIKVNYQAGRGALTILANPVTNGTLRFVITGLTNQQKAEASVMDYSGRVVARMQASLLTNNEIPVSHLASGMYRLVIRAGNETIQESFVK